MTTKLTNEVKELQKEKARELIYFVTRTRTQHIGLIPTFEELTDHYIITNRKMVRIFLKLDSVIFQRLKYLIRKFA
jgi:hypothetical protein